MSSVNSECTTVDELKAELRKRGARLSGRKIDLLGRLEAYKRHENFGHSSDLVKEFNMDLPNITIYKDVNSDSPLPPFPFETIEAYLNPLGKLLGDKPKALFDGCEHRQTWMCSAVYVARESEYIDDEASKRRLAFLVKNKLNFGHMPCSGLYQPANIKTLANDHDYLSKSDEDCFLDEALVTKISESQISEIEVATRQQALCKRWYAERCKRLHASKFGLICKATERTNFPLLARGMTKITKINSAPLQHGRKYEPVATQKYEDLMDCEFNEDKEKLVLH
ncbi:hypothetical protein ScPMuIL_009750 [Solemya velum]